MTTEQILSQAFGLYELKRPEAELIRHNENMTYKITDIDKQYVLRIHKPVEGFSPDLYDINYSHDELIKSELEIISALKTDSDLSIQTPVCGINGSLVQALSDNTPVTLLEWVDGQTVESAGTTPEILNDSGKLMAKMHMFYLQKAKSNKKYKRYNYDQTILPRIAERIENATRVDILKQEQARIILNALDEMQWRFDELDNIREKHIVHADLGKSNVIISADGMCIYNNDVMVGFLMYDIDPETKRWELSRFMIAKEYQGKGYGRQALLLLLEKIKKTLGPINFYTSIVPTNSSMKKLIKEMGFSETGEIMWEEEVFCISL